MEGREPGEGGEGRPERPLCPEHPDRKATALCVSCGKALCTECDCRYGDLHYCARCLPAQGPESVAPPVPPPRHAVLPPTYPYGAPGYPGGYPCGGCGAAYAYPLVFPAPARPEPEDPREKRWWKADWKLSEVLLALLLIFGAYNVLAVVLVLVAERSLFFSYLAYAVFFCPLIAFSTWYILRRHRRGREELGLRLGKARRTVGFGLAGSLTALGMSYAAFFVLLLFFYLIAGKLPASSEWREAADMHPAMLGLIVFVVVILAPLFEETFFRGLLYPPLRERMGPMKAVIVNGALFGILHFQPLFMPSLVLVGIVLAFLYEKTDSLVAPMLAHALYNLSVVLISVFTGW